CNRCVLTLASPASNACTLLKSNACSTSALLWYVEARYTAVYLRTVYTDVNRFLCQTPLAVAVLGYCQIKRVAYPVSAQYGILTA
ncbi:MAG TPA: hypothetical protein VE844_20180, partial [Gammaproteobacteria bacterium]|nr:hypothetical protein [Gammaproteobacteria bacterium]